MKKFKTKLNKLKPRDWNIKVLIASGTKHGAHTDRKKRASKDACREEIEDDDESLAF